MSNPYRLDPEALRAKQKEKLEQKFVTLQDDSAKPPPTIGTSAFQSILFGPTAGQPSRDSSSQRSSWTKRLFLGAVFLGLAGLMVRAFLHQLMR
jgi:hypothetical protein